MSEIRPDNISDHLIEVGPGVRVPASWDVLVTGEAGVPGQIRVSAEYDPTLERVVATGVAVDRAGEGEEITSVTLREVRVQTFVSHTAVDLVQIANDSTTVPLRDFLATARKREWNPQESQAIAPVVYRAATTASIPPLKTVAHAFTISQSTATRLIARTRNTDTGITHDTGPAAQTPPQASRPTTR